MGSNLIQVHNLTPLEAIIKGNAERRIIPSNSRFNRMLLETGEWKNYSWHNYTGTGFAIEAPGKPFGKTVEKAFAYEGEKKVLIYYVRKEDIGAENLMHLFEHQFRQDGESTIQLINAKTGKQILAVEGLHEADEIILKVAGGIRNFKLTKRDGGAFETGGTKIWADFAPALGLLRRGVYGMNHVNRDAVFARNFLDNRYAALYEDAAKQETAEVASDSAEKKAPGQ